MKKSNVKQGKEKEISEAVSISLHLNKNNAFFPLLSMFVSDWPPLEQKAKI